ncbi:MAG: hypothetical protein J7484_07585 [Microbacterium sp.]|nr:hypothetical protein [Microbacterium sp.]
MHPAFLYLPGERLALPELSAARLDGLVVEVGECYIPADLVEGPDVRAASLAPLLPPGTAAAGPSAAWVHGAGDRPPTRHHVRRAVGHRLRLPQHRRLVFHDAFVPASDRVLTGGVWVTTVTRTLCDLARGLHRDPTLLPWLRLLAAAAPDRVQAAVESITAYPTAAGSLRALSTLTRLADRAAVSQEEVTR